MAKISSLTYISNHNLFELKNTVLKALNDVFDAKNSNLEYHYLKYATLHKSIFYGFEDPN